MYKKFLKYSKKFKKNKWRKEVTRTAIKKQEDARRH